MVGLMHKVKKEYLDEAEAVLLSREAKEILAEHFQEMDEFFKKNPEVKKKWDKFQVKKVSKKVY
jgi:hypothetical protein